MLLERINQDIKIAIKKGDDFCVSVLRMMVAASKNKEIEKRGACEKPELSDEEIIEILSREIKKRKEAAGVYFDAGRKDLSDKELKEVLIIQNYLPAQVSFEEIEKVVAEAIKSTGAAIQKDFGKAMKAAMAELKGKADASLVSEIIRKKLV